MHIIWKRKQNPYKYLKSIMPGLKKLCVDLEDLEKEYQNPFERILAFFELMSPWHDRITRESRDILKFRQYDGDKYYLDEKVRALFQFIESGGRNVYSINRSMPGSPPHKGNVLLGKVLGVSGPCSVQCYLEDKGIPPMKKEKWGEYEFARPIDDNEIVGHWFIPMFIGLHMPIIKVVKDLDEELRKIL